MNQFVELIYVSLYELADLLSIMRQYLTPEWLYTEEMNTTKFHSVPKIVPLRLPTEELNTTSSHMTSEDYHVKMESAFQRFWSNNTIGSLPKTYKF
ncbi:unnamed protein product, partial [Mesorhabditis belari]|uniref:Uncharacterized protein n=1 Tax=Mesorhabditis belari TaxID=2138241 RepID=A0AAF3FAJ5_9BILA